MFKKCIVYGVVAIAICSCTQNEEIFVNEESVETDVNHFVDTDEAVKNAEEYLSSSD